MSALRRRFRSSLFIENLEDRLTPAPTLLQSLPLQSPFVAWDYSTGPFNASPVYADLDGDGQQEILAVSGDGQLNAYKYNPGTGTVGISRTFATGALAAPIQSTPIVVNLPSGKAVFAANKQGSVFGWNGRTGAMLPGWPATVHVDAVPTLGHPQPDSVYAALAAGDLEGSGVPQIVVTSFNREVTAFRADGSVMWRFNKDDTVFSGVAIGDLNHDGKLEVVVGGDSSPSQFYWSGGRINCLSWDGRREWVKQTDQVIWSSPVLADLRGDGNLAVVVGTGFFYPNAGNVVYALDSKGNDLPGWPFVTGPAGTDAKAGTSPAIADLFGDGNLDVIAADNQGRLHAIRPSGQEIWSAQAAFPGGQWSSPIVADIDGDGRADVIIGATDGRPDGATLRAFDGQTGAQIWAYPQPGQASGPRFTASAVGHFKGDASWQLAAIWNGLGNGAVLSPSTLEVFNLAPTTLTPPWGQLRHDSDGNVVTRSNAYVTNFVTNLYTNALGRSPGTADLNFWVPLFTRAGSLRPLIAGIVGSGEARTLQINSWYQKYLGRAAEPGGVANWSGLINQGVPYAAVKAVIVGSDEAFNRAGGTNPAWVRYMYQNILNRNPLDSEVNFWTSALNAGQIDRAHVAYGFLYSPENTSDFVTQVYQTYQPGGLSAPAADSLAAAGWDLRRGKIEELVLSDILVSNGDYVATHQEGSWVRGAYQDMLRRTPSAGETAGWIASIEKGLTISQLSTFLSRSPEYNSVLVNSWYQSYLGRFPGAGEAAGWVNQLNSGVSRVSIVNALVQSDEYWARAGSNPTGFLNKIFVDLLGRLPSADEANRWLAQPNPRVFLPTLLLVNAPQGYFQNLVDSYYLALLRRLSSTLPDQGRIIPQGTPFGGQGFLDALLGGANPADVQATILSSPEYLDVALSKAFWGGAHWLS